MTRPQRQIVVYRLRAMLAEVRKRMYEVMDLMVNIGNSRNDQFEPDSSDYAYLTENFVEPLERMFMEYTVRETRLEGNISNEINKIRQSGGIIADHIDDLHDQDEEESETSTE